MDRSTTQMPLAHCQHSTKNGLGERLFTSKSVSSWATKPRALLAMDCRRILTCSCSKWSSSLLDKSVRSCRVAEAATSSEIAVMAMNGEAGDVGPGEPGLRQCTARFFERRFKVERRRSKMRTDRGSSEEEELRELAMGS